jgi:hypothetical protein
VAKHLLNRIYKKYISKKSQYLHQQSTTSATTTSTTTSDSTISSLYQNLLTKADKKRMAEFVQMGTMLPKEFFHPIVKACLLSLVPWFKSFLLTSLGEMYRQQILDCDAEYVHCHIVRIQNKWRVISSKKAIQRKRMSVGGS